jgi:hypothetical protein
MAAGELLDGDGSRTPREMLQEKGFEPGDIKFFAAPDGLRMIEKVVHFGFVRSGLGGLASVDHQGVSGHKI